MKHELHSVFIKEQKRYSLENLKSLFQMEEENTISIVKKLKSFGILRAVKNSDKQKNETELLDDDIEISDVEMDSTEYLYVCTFVGVLKISQIILKCYPKYIHSNSSPVQELKQVLKVIDKFNKKEQVIKFQNEFQDELKFNRLAVILYLLNDYYENGVYRTSQSIYEINGEGEINWNKTINDTFAIISNNRPYYTELITKRSINDEFDFFKRLHETILTACSNELKQSGLLELFDFLEVDISDESLDEFGDIEFVLDQIQKELNVQFNTRKQLLLKTMYSFIANKEGLTDIDEFSLFGTNSFHVIWEKICASVLDNHLNRPLRHLPVELSPEYIQYQDTTLKRLIEKPKWQGVGINVQEADQTLIPDLITIQKYNECNWQFLIFDAKYYNLRLGEGVLSGQPGIESITKQYLYQMAYKDFLEKHSILLIKNSFLFPTESDEIIDAGEVYMDMFADLVKIKLRMLPATLVYDTYLKNSKIDILDLNL